VQARDLDGLSPACRKAACLAWAVSAMDWIRKTRGEAAGSVALPDHALGVLVDGLGAVATLLADDLRAGAPAEPARLPGKPTLRVIDGGHVGA
jgi:hypothetical protein